MSQDHELEKKRLSQGSDKSLTVSELHEMVAIAVEEAVAPLKERISELETGGGVVEDEPLQLEPASRRLDLEDLDHNLVEDSTEDAVSSRRKRVH